MFALLELVVVIAVAVAAMKLARRALAAVPEGGRRVAEQAVVQARLRAGAYGLREFMQGMIATVLGSALPGVERSHLPNWHRFGLHPQDMVRWGRFVPELRQELVEMLMAETAKRPDLRLSGPLQIEVAEDAAAQPGRPVHRAMMRRDDPPRAQTLADQRTTSIDVRGCETVLLAGEAPQWLLVVGNMQTPIADQLIVGRGHDADLRLPVERLSRRHARLNVVDGLLSLTDLSTNGTWVNGARIDVAVLQDGDRVDFARQVTGCVVRV